MKSNMAPIAQPSSPGSTVEGDRPLQATPQDPLQPPVSQNMIDHSVPSSSSLVSSISDHEVPHPGSEVNDGYLLSHDVYSREDSIPLRSQDQHFDQTTIQYTHNWGRGNFANFKSSWASFRQWISRERFSGRPKWHELKSGAESLVKMSEETSHNFSIMNHLVAFLKTTGTSILAKGTEEEEKEKPKPFMEEKTSMALIRCFVHVIPASAAIFLLILNGEGYYIGGELSGASGQDTEKLAALSFAAKLHELTMLASLGSILITYIRKELAFGDGIPLGALFAGLQYQELSFFLSQELWGTILHDWAKTSTKWFMLSLIIVCTFLGITVGPSTTNLMKPRLDDWPAGGSYFWINCTADVLFPVEMRASSNISHCNVDNEDLSCPAGNWQTISENYFSFFPHLVDAGDLPQNITISSPASVRTFGMRSRNVAFPYRLIWADAFTLATTPISAVADSLAELGRLWSYAAANINIGNFEYRNDVLFKVNSMQPVVLSYCNQTEYSGNENITLSFPALGSISLSSGPNSAASSTATVAEYITLADSTAVTNVTASVQLGEHPSILWIDDAELLNQTQSTLAAVFVLPATETNQGSYFTCSIDSRFANVTLLSRRNVIKVVAGEPSNFANNGTFHADWRKVALTADWARYLTPQLSSSNHSILTPIASRAGIFKGPIPSGPWYFEIIVENIITTLVANGIGRASYPYGLVSTLKDDIDPNDLWYGGNWAHDIIPKGGKMGRGGNAFNVSSFVRRRSAEFRMEALVNGYAYSPTGIVQKAQLVVFVVYVCMVLPHILWSLFTGLSSGGWGSAAEIAALAWNSSPSNTMRNTGAGIDTVNVFKARVRVLQRDAGEFVNLELVVDDEHHEDSFLKKVRANDKYG